MARKNYTDEFRRRAVDLCESTPGATLKGIAADLGVSRGALKEWVVGLGSGTTTTGSPVAPAAVRPESQAARITRLEAENQALRAEQACLPRSGTFCVRRRSISPGRRTGEPLPVRRRPQGRLGREAVV